ncbi:sensor histidine kinase [Pontimicrobium sp. SW4]|uniref:Sensor histidine kinase n=1 Tax=Pontimicrobium sp. SW4 TaxID=3153519 RepID=A0AAU7BNK8_9FLAO
MISKTVPQIILSYIAIYVLIPFLLNKKRKVLFVISSLVLIYFAYTFHTALRCYYLVPKYPEIFSVRPPLIFIERITNVYAFLGNITGLIFPTIILMVLNYYRHQKEILSLKERQKSSELEALKNQLNPHFLFNTLNNLYALSLKKSDKSPEVIERLSDILDYILYKCKDKYVNIEGEIDLLENYIALEKLRYGKRLNIVFNHSVEDNIKIAPLLLLTLTENAFKHGVEEEINVASIKIQLKATKKEIYFNIENTIPVVVSTTNDIVDNRESIGLKNIEKQLQLLYKSNNYVLHISDKNNVFGVILKLISK